MAHTTLQTVRRFQESLAVGTSEWKGLFAEGVTFKGPVDTVRGIAANIELNERFLPMMKGYEPLNEFESGNFASLEGVYTLLTPNGKYIEIEMSEIYEVKDGKIETIRIYYDAEEFRKEFALAMQ